MVSCEFSPTREALENESIELPCVKSRTFINISTLKRCFKNKMFIRIPRFHVKVPYYWDQEGKLVNQSFMWCNFLFRLLLKEAFDSERLPRRFRFVFPLCFLWQHASKFQKLIWKITQHKSFTAKKTTDQNQPQKTWLIEWMAVKERGRERGAISRWMLEEIERGGGGGE